MWAQDTAAMFGYAANSSPPSVYTNLTPVAEYVEHACLASEKAFRELDTSDHLHLTAGSSRYSAHSRRAPDAPTPRGSAPPE